MMDEIIDTRLLHPRDQIVTIISRIYKMGMTTTSGGNISILDDDGNMWITPASVDKGALGAYDIMCVEPDGKIIGPHKPSSEYPFHRAIYKIRPDIKAIVHAHPPALVSFSIVHAVPDTRVISQTRHYCGTAGYAAYALPGSEALGITIADEFRKGYMALLMENHGVVAGGKDIVDAFGRFESLEMAARAILYGSMIGKPDYLSDEKIDAYMSQLSAQLPEMNLVKHTQEESDIRKDMCHFVHRGCNQGLMAGNYGTVSVRWHGDDFLVTPADISRWDMQPDDIVQIHDGKCEHGKNPSRATALISEIYKKNPGIRSVILTQPPYLMAFAVTHSKLDVRTIPESWIFLQDIPSVPFGRQDEIPDILAGEIPAVIIENDSVLVTGQSILQAFDRLEVAEFSAKSLVMAKPIGELIPITDTQVEELRQTFLTPAKK